MHIEYEATFPHIEIEDIRSRLLASGATLVHPMFLQKRAVFFLPKGHEVEGGWLRVRDEGDKITLSLKVVDGVTIQNQKEICLTVDSFTEACDMLTGIGCTKKAYQETRRELWMLDGVSITIDEWPFLLPFVEIEGESEVVVKNVSERIGFSYADARFCHVGTLYGERYHFHESVFNDKTPILTFDMENPFMKK